MVMVRGEVGAVEASVSAGLQGGNFSVIDSFVIPNIHESVFRPSRHQQGGCARSPGSDRIVFGGLADRGADAAVKAANVELIEVRLAMALGGKAFVTMTGNVAAVQAAVDAGSEVVGRRGLLVNRVVIPHPRPELLNEMI